jgi:hypothetical protein
MFSAFADAKGALNAYESAIVALESRCLRLCKENMMLV